MRRKLLTGALLVGGTIAGAVVYRRRFSRRDERVDLYYEDGSMSSVTNGSAGAARLLELAHGVLRAAGS